GARVTRSVREPHHHRVHPLPVIAREQTKNHAERESDALRDDADGERHARSVYETSPYVAAVDVGSEPVLRRRRLERVDEIEAERIMPGDERRGERHERKQDDRTAPEPGAPIGTKPL